MSDQITATDLEKARAKARLITDYHRTFGTDTGKRVLDDMRRAFGTKAPTFMPCADGHYDTHGAAIRDGQRQVVSHIEYILENTQPDGDGNVDKPAVTIITETQEK